MSSDKSISIIPYKNDGNRDSTFGNNGGQVTGGPDHTYLLGQMMMHHNRLYAAGSLQTNGLDITGVLAAYQLEETVLLSCVNDKEAATDRNLCSAVISGIDPKLAGGGNDAMVTYKLTGATTGSGSGSASGLVFNKGVTEVTYSLKSNPSSKCSFIITVRDKEAPVISGFFATPFILLPSNHQMKTVTIHYSLSDNCTADASLSVSSSEPQTGTGPGDIGQDFEVLDAHHVKLRAESSAISFTGFFPYLGRVYSVKIEAHDAAGNKQFKTIWVLVPPLQWFDFFDLKKVPHDLLVTAMPNPSANRFSLVIQGTGGKPFSIRVSNAVGRMMETKIAGTGKQTIEIGATYPPGVYFVEVSQGLRKKTIKLIKLDK